MIYRHRIIEMNKEKIRTRSAIPEIEFLNYACENSLFTKRSVILNKVESMNKTIKRSKKVQNMLKDKQINSKIDLNHFNTEHMFHTSRHSVWPQCNQPLVKAERSYINASFFDNVNHVDNRINLEDAENFTCHTFKVLESFSNENKADSSQNDSASIADVVPNNENDYKSIPIAQIPGYHLASNSLYFDLELNKNAGPEVLLDKVMKFLYSPPLFYYSAFASVVRSFGKPIGYINISTYFEHFFNFHTNSILLGFILYKRFLKKIKFKNLDQIRKAFFICCIIASKHQEDSCTRNKEYIKNYMDLYESNLLERIILKRISYNIHATVQEMYSAALEMLKCDLIHSIEADYLQKFLF